ncbi:hypothetical protein E2C01_062632 [Portunus trituberculatus]|uniref:Uncharacterized protein n=1 Tax=Portunus trituberculatus TaxID=210409 RepID=A0A5B7H8E8_PORTR|nr:hypothetical protein [Portunus trituberculatus]
MFHSRDRLRSTASYR